MRWTTVQLSLTALDRRLLAAVAVALLGAAAAIGLLDGVTERDDLAAFDPLVSSMLVDLRSPGWTAAASTLTVLGSAEALVPLTLLLLGGLLLRRRWLAAALVGLGMSSSLLVTIALKDVVARSRPPVEAIGPATTGFAFPSGHTLNSTMFLGLAAGLLLLQLRRTWARARWSSPGMSCSRPG